MKKILFLGVLMCFFSILIIGESNNCLEIDGLYLGDEEIGRLFSWDNEECSYRWEYISKKGASDGFSIEDLESKHGENLLLQFAGPFTDQDGTTQGISVEKGNFVESDVVGYSVLVLIDNQGVISFGNGDLDWSSFFEKGGSGFEQALMIRDGAVLDQVKDNWQIYKNNKLLNYRFLVEDRFGEVKLVDFYEKIGLKDALDLILEEGYVEVVYLDIVGSELGYYMENGVYKRLGGVGAINLYSSKSPGGFLELYFE